MAGLKNYYSYKNGLPAESDQPSCLQEMGREPL